jgi:hypothetical protein
MHSVCFTRGNNKRSLLMYCFTGGWIYSGREKFIEIKSVLPKKSHRTFTNTFLVLCLILYIRLLNAYYSKEITINSVRVNLN